MADNSPLTTRVQRIAAIDARAKSAELDRAAIAGSKPSLTAAVAIMMVGGNYMIVSPDMIKMLRNPIAALLLARIYFWYNTPTSQARGGEFWWEMADVIEQTGLTRASINTAKGLLIERKILMITKKGMPPKSWWKLDVEELGRQAVCFLDS